MGCYDLWISKYSQIKQNSKERKNLVPGIKTHSKAKLIKAMWNGIQEEILFKPHLRKSSYIIHIHTKIQK